MNSKRKSRGGGGAATMPGRSERTAPPKQRSRTPEKDLKESSPNDSNEFNGIYNNASLTRFTHALTSLIGVHLRVETKNKDQYEGIFKTFSPNLEIVLELTHKIDHNSQDTVDLNSVEDKMVFPLATVVRYFATDVDMEFAIKESFLTDSQIAQNKLNGEVPMRELEMWQPEDDGSGGGIEDDDLTSNNGWSAHDMFAKNEEFGVKTSYDPNMAAYTVQLNKDRLDSETEQRAARIAASIEGEGKNRLNTELENGDEEEAFSAVVRPGDKRNGRERESPGDDKSSTYVPPGKRDAREARGGYSRGRGQRTPPPSRYDNYEDRDHRQRDDRRERYSNNRSGHREDRSYNDRGHGDRDRGHQSSYHREDRNYNRDDRGYGRQDSHGKKDDYRGGNYNHDASRGGGAGGFQEHRGGSNQPRPPSAHDNRRDDRKSSEKVSPLPPQEVEKLERRKSGEMQRSPEAETGLPPRDGSRRKLEKTKEQSAVELHDFHQKFNLKLGEGGSSSSGPPQVSPSTPTVSINPDVVSSHVMSSPREPLSAPSPRESLAAPSPRGENITSTPRPSPKSVTPTQVAAGPAQPSGSPPDLKKSTLNPNAKEFTLNPGAKEFTPRVMAPRPSATPPRPQTPGTPGQMVPNMYTSIIPIQNQGVGQPMGGGTYTHINNNQRPMRPNSKDGGHLRQDLPSPMQVQQVTGQPILAQQLHQAPAGYYPPAQVQYMHGPGQPHIMRIMPPGMMHANLVHVPLSSHGGIPGQGGGGVITGVHDQNQFIPTSQYQNSHAPPQMWTQQIMTAPSQMPTGPPQQGGMPHGMSATPPTQGHTPAPSPGPQIIGYAQTGGQHQPNSLPQYPMILMANGPGGLPQFHQAPLSGGPPMGGPGQLMPQPGNSLQSMQPHFQYMQGTGQMPMMAQNHHHQQ